MEGSAVHHLRVYLHDRAFFLALGEECMGHIFPGISHFAADVFFPSFSEEGEPNFCFSAVHPVIHIARDSIRLKLTMDIINCFYQQFTYFPI